jgi:A/G-specific adenine glycosylase
MLQQTRAETVRPRFEAFLRAFPDARALAGASEDEVLSRWSGLGYYSRARNLRRGAAVVAESHGGRFPRDVDEARRLPGVGPYTAAAVLSIAYGVPLAVVDGNVRRVLARLFRLEPPADRGAACASLAQALLDPRRPGDGNQAVMELGATVCLPRRPRCDACPVARFCRALRDGAVSEHPRPRPRAAVAARRVRLYLLRDARGRLLLERGRWPLLPHLWLPVIREPASHVERARRSSARRSRNGGRIDSLPARLQPRENGPAPLGRFRHAITRHRLTCDVFGGAVRPGAGRLPRELGFFSADALSGIGRSSILEKALRCERAARDR